MIQIGDKLPNGATVLDLGYRRNHVGEKKNYVLCFTSSSAVTPFVSWFVDINDPSSTSIGHYSKTLEECFSDFKERLGKLNVIERFAEL